MSQQGMAVHAYFTVELAITGFDILVAFGALRCYGIHLSSLSICSRLSANIDWAATRLRQPYGVKYLMLWNMHAGWGTPILNPFTRHGYCWRYSLAPAVCLAR